MLDAAPEPNEAFVAADPALQTRVAGATRTIIANTTIQFVDLAVDIAANAPILDRYFEERAAASESPSLYHIELDESGAAYHPVTNEPVASSLMYAIDGRRAFDALAGVWLPLPFMRVIEDPRDGGERLDEGPSNWVRIFIAPRESGRDIFRLVLAIDTSFEPATGGRGGPQIAPTHDDATASRRFRSSAALDDIGWFVTESWVDEWLVEAFRDLRPRVPGEDGRDEPAPQRPLEHLAHYLTLLNVLAEADVLPELQLLPVTRRLQGHRPVPVDLVLDIGASRTCALLCERALADGMRAPIHLLPLRDLARPTHVRRGCFSSRIEFARTSFGRDVYSRWSGRTSAFYWPSLTRVGEEAVRLASEQTSADAYTGLSSPIRYLWDGEPSRHVWRFSGGAGAPQRRNALIAGHLLTHLTETGDVQDPKTRRQPTTKPRFSRSSLTTFFAAELILHAVSSINSPDYREPLDRPTAPRRLARIVLTPPAAMQAQERAILQQRVEAAVHLVWQAHGWSMDEAADAADALAPPEVVLGVDGATAAQLAFLDNEIGAKFDGNARQYMSLLGRTRNGHGTVRSLRIATLDIGGGSSGLAIATHTLDAGGLVVRPDLVEGFPTGGDDVLKAIVEAMVLPAVERKLADSKLADARRFITALAHGETHGRASRIAELRRRFASEIAMPAAVALLREHETLRATEDDRTASRSLRSLLAVSGVDATAAAAELESLASDEGSDSFELLDAEVPFTLSQIADIVRQLLRPVVGNAARAIRNLDCDMLLLTGWLTRLPIVRDMLLEGMPIRPDRIIAMHDYRMRAWFPGRLASGSIHDPKPLAAVGALIASSPDAAVGGHRLQLKAPIARTPPTFVGQLGADGLVADDAVLFQLDGASPAARAAARQATLTVEPPLTLGVRRAPIAAWPALPLYALVLADMSPDALPRMPLRVTIEWSANGATTERPWIVRATDADGGELGTAEIALRLQTLASADGGYWLDTGAFAVA